MALCVPDAQQPGTPGNAQEPQQDANRCPVRSAQCKWQVQRLIKRRAFFQPVDGERPEFELPFAASQPPAWLRRIALRKGLDDRVSQYLRQCRALVTGDDEKVCRIPVLGPQYQPTGEIGAGLDSKNPRGSGIGHRVTINGRRKRDHRGRKGASFAPRRGHPHSRTFSPYVGIGTEMPLRHGMVDEIAKFAGRGGCITGDLQISGPGIRAVGSTPGILNGRDGGP